MELNEKLRELRRQKGMTQEELAQKLYVSRTAISKWESGRGYPNIDSLKAIAECFSVTLDELLSSEEVLAVAEADQKGRNEQMQNTVFALLDLCAILLLVLPLFGQRTEVGVLAVSLLSPHIAIGWLRVPYLVVVFATVAWGAFALVSQAFHRTALQGICQWVSLLFGIATALLFILSQQPYAAIYALTLLAGKAVLRIKRP